MDTLSNQRSGRVFQNRVLELLTRTSPAIVWTTFIPVLGLIVFYDYWAYDRSALEGIALFGGGLFAWTLAEYLLHRYVFHFINDSPWVQRFHHYAHGYHHAHPRDRDHLFMPVPLSLTLTFVFLGVFWLLLGERAFSFHPGFVTGYLIYSTLHYSMHAFPQAPRLLRGLWRHHHLHHYKHTHAAFGVSSTLWDRVFGTMPKASQTAGRSN